MTGLEFSAIRRFNQISQEYFAYLVRLSNRSSIYDIEQKYAVPTKYVSTLSKAIGVDLNNDKNFKKVLAEVPEEYKKPISRQRNSIYA